MSKENRQHPRVKANWPVIINTPQEPIAGVTKNISAGGALICIQKPLKPGEELLFSKSHVHPSMSRLSIGSKVTRHDIEKLDNQTFSLNMGVQFTKLSSEARKLISEHVSTHLKREGLKSKTDLEQKISEESKMPEKNNRSVGIEIRPKMYPMIKIHWKQQSEYKHDALETDVSFPKELWENIAKTCDEIGHGMGAFSSPKMRKVLTLMAARIMAEIDAEDKRLRYKESYESFLDFVEATSNRADLDRVRKGQLIHEKACQIQLQSQCETDLD
jgi:ribosomal protein L31E